MGYEERQREEREEEGGWAEPPGKRVGKKRGFSCTGMNMERGRKEGGRKAVPL